MIAALPESALTKPANIEIRVVLPARFSPEQTKPKQILNIADGVTIIRHISGAYSFYYVVSQWETTNPDTADNAPLLLERGINSVELPEQLSSVDMESIVPLVKNSLKQKCPIWYANPQIHTEI